MTMVYDCYAPGSNWSRSTVRKTLAYVATVAALGLAGCSTTPETTEPPQGPTSDPPAGQQATPAETTSEPEATTPEAALPEDVADLRVAVEDRIGYDRDLFGEADRESLLADNLADHPDCDGYYSAADDQCYTEPGEVDVDHIVALSEAWDSGASSWDADRLDAYAGDLANLWLMTDNLNQSKGDDDIAEWLPPHGPAVCGYVAAYVEVKLEWDLAVDEAERDALIDAVADCG